MNVAVIGAAGFIGYRIATLLAQRSDVKSLSLIDRVPVSSPNNASVHVGDFSDTALQHKALAGVDTVIMLAAVLGGAAERDPQAAFHVNLHATISLVEWLRARSNPVRFVFASTVAVYGEKLPDPVTEETPLTPVMLYGAQKLMLEVLLANYARKGWLDAVSLRPPGVTARDGSDAELKSAFISRLFHAVKRGEDIILPVAAHHCTWLASVNTVASNFIHAAALPDIGSRRAFTLPALTLTFGELVQALKTAFPASPSKVGFEPDAEMVALFGRCPHLHTATADNLGFIRDADALALVKASF